jgi:hypothetical protein
LKQTESMPVVPVLIGLTVPTARDVCVDIRIVPISRTPDGPGLAAQTWPGRWVVTAQDPEPGVEVAPGDTVTIEFIEDGPPNADVPARLVPPKPALNEHAVPEREAEPLAAYKPAAPDRSGSSSDDYVR